MQNVNAKGIIGAIFALTLGVIFTVNLLAPQITGIFEANTTGWDTGTAALWAVLGIIVVAAIAILFLKITGIIAYIPLALAFANIMLIASGGVGGAVVVQIQ